MPRLQSPRPPRERYQYHRHYAYAQLSDVEYEVLKAAARKENLSISDFVRRCVNSYLLELDEDTPLLQEQETGPSKRVRA
jgi:hypothetical protein